jgi:hypothetical protein
MGWMTGCCNGPDSDSTMQEILVRGLALGMRRGWPAPGPRPWPVDALTGILHRLLG